MKKSRWPILTAAVLVSAALAGCTSTKWGFPYKAAVQQGNWITKEQVAQLKPGMTREQVRFIMGSATLTSVLHADRWDYPYYFKPGYGAPTERKFTVFFKDDHLERWVGDPQPELQPYQLAAQDAKNAKKTAADTAIDDSRAQEDLTLVRDLHVTPFGVYEGTAIGDPMTPGDTPGTDAAPLD